MVTAAPMSLQKLQSDGSIVKQTYFRRFAGRRQIVGGSGSGATAQP